MVDNDRNQAKPEAVLDELFNGLWAISITARHMAAKIKELKENAGGHEDEQDVRIRCCCQRNPQVR